MTYSIIAHDPEEQAWGVAVASKFLAVGAIVSWAQAGAGAIATQAYAKVSFGPGGLAILAEGKSAQETLTALLTDDPKREMRQVSIVDANGEIAAHTGSQCHDWAGHKPGKGFCCQGNILTGENTLTAMSEAFLRAKGELADRLMTALLAGDKIGGDKRGKQSAALFVARQNSGYGGDHDRYIDLRVDDDPEPVQRLRDLLRAHHIFFGAPKPDNQTPIEEDIARELQSILIREGYLGGEADGDWNEVCKEAFWILIGNENLEERWNLDSNTDLIDRELLEYLRKRFP